MPTPAQLAQWRARHQPHGEEVSPWLLAVVAVVTREINLLRQEHGLPMRTQQQVFTAIRTQVDDLTVE